jgi:DNA-binding NarL/FixJ family response regulator
VRVVIAEDSVLLREGVAGLLQDAGHAVVARVGDAGALLVAVAEHEPELAILDARMPPSPHDGGMAAAAAIRERFPATGALVVAQRVETRHAVSLVSRGGGVGYLLKERILDVDDFIDAAVRVAGGGTALDPEVVAALVAPRGVDDPLGDLTPREREVLALVAEGRTDAGIARRLWLTEATVEAHVRAILHRLGPAAGPDDRRRMAAVLASLRATASRPPQCWHRGQTGARLDGGAARRS